MEIDQKIFMYIITCSVFYGKKQFLCAPKKTSWTHQLSKLYWAARKVYMMTVTLQSQPLASAVVIISTMRYRFSSRRMRLPVAAWPNAARTHVRIVHRIVHSHCALSRDTFVQYVGHQPWAVRKLHEIILDDLIQFRFFFSLVLRGKEKSLWKTMEKNDKFIHFIWCIVRAGAWHGYECWSGSKRESKSIWYGFSDIGVAFLTRHFTSHRRLSSARHQ